MVSYLYEKDTFQTFDVLFVDVINEYQKYALAKIFQGLETQDLIGFTRKYH